MPVYKHARVYFIYFTRTIQIIRYWYVDNNDIIIPTIILYCVCIDEERKIRSHNIVVVAAIIIL